MKLSVVRRIALSLPEATEEPHFEYTSFRVRKKIFATAPPTGDYLHVFVPDDDRDPALALHGEFVEKLLWGGKIRGLRIRLADASADVVTDLLHKAWAHRAPKSLVTRSLSAPSPAR